MESTASSSKKSQHCAHCTASAATLKRCGGCRQVLYCGSPCQKAHWRAHRPACLDFRAAQDEALTQRVREIVEVECGQSKMVPLAYNDPAKFYVVCMARRAGTPAFIQAVEFTHFDPKNKDLNDLFEVSQTVWETELFFIAGVPAEYAEKVKECARAVGMKVVNGIPTLLCNGETTHFPLSGKNVWTLEGK